MACNVVSPAPVIAHRGASGSAPENTQAAMLLAKQMGCSWVEVDCRLTADGQVIIIHNDTINAVSDGVGLVNQLTVAQLQSFDAGSWFNAEFSDQTFLTLSELLNLLETLQLHVNLELKPNDNDTQHLVDVVYNTLSSTHFTQSIIISSFSFQALQYCWQQPLLYPLGYLCSHFNEQIDRHLSIIPFHCINIAEEMANESILDHLRQYRLPIYAYTVNTLTRYATLKKLGIDGVFTDFPARLLAVT